MKPTVEPSLSEPDEQVAHAEARVGTLVGGKWRVHRVLGVGGMAAVYEAVHQHNQRKVAIKILHSHLCHLEDVRERFMQEAHAANRVQHRGAVPALDDGELENGAPYLVLDFLDGQSLDRRWRRSHHRLSVEEVFAVSEQLLDILEAAHKNGVLHRDIKPENVFLTSEGEVKLLDFGISRITGVDRSHKTELGSMMGTPAFMAPEQARGRWTEMDARSDLFAVGASMYTLLSGRTIHDAETANELLLKVMTEPVPDIRGVAPHIPDFAAKVVNKAVSFNKEDRYQTAFEMKLAVASVNATFGRGLKSLLNQDDFAMRTSSIPPLPILGSTHRPVTFAEKSLIYATGDRFGKVWKGAIVAALMTTTAAFSYYYFRTPSPVKTITFSPVAGSDATGRVPNTDVMGAANRGADDQLAGITLEEIETAASARKERERKQRWAPPPAARAKASADSSPTAAEPAPATSPVEQSQASATSASPAPPPAPPVQETANEKPEVVFDPLSRRR